MASLGAEHKLECKSMVLTLHTLFDIPRDLVSLHSRRESVELVLKPTAKYYSENKRFCKLDLPEQHVAFSPSSIIFKHDRFVLDFESAPPPCGLSFARSSTPHGAASFANSMPSNFVDLLAANTTLTAPGVASSTGKMPLHFESDARAGGALPPKPRLAFGESVDEDQDVNLRSPGSLKLRTSTTTLSSAMPPNQIVLRYPTRSDLKVIVEVMVGARQRRHDSSAVRWITPSWADRSIPGTISTFAAADGEVMRHKLVNRFVGLTVGHLSCTMELPHAADDLREVPAFAPTAIADAAERLCNDYERLRRFHTTDTEEQLNAVRSERPARLRDFVEQLSTGASEFSIYRGLLLEVCPSFFVRRIRRICAMYPPIPQSSSWVRTDAETLAAEHTGREMSLIRNLCAELGPDLSAISPRNRFLSYTNVQPLGDELWKWIKDNYAHQENDILDYEPDMFMESLALHYGTPEPAPIQYGFSPISYELDRRAYFCDSLRFPVNREHHRYRDEAMAARQMRVPLQLTPCERPLRPIRPTSRSFGEIDILLEKYKPEFVQLVPSIADAMECVTQQNEHLLRELLRESQPAVGAAGANASTRERMHALPYEVCPHGFHLFQSERPSGSYVALLTRFAEYTYISVSTLLASVIYLDRLCLRHPRLLLTTRNIEKLLVAAVRVASKIVDLRSVNNKNFASVFSVPVQDMNELESEFLKLMNFDFFLSPKEFNNYAHLVQLPAAYMQMPSSVRLSNTVSANGTVESSAPPPSASHDSADHVADVGHSGNGAALRPESNTNSSNTNKMLLNTPAVATPAPPRAPSPPSQQQGRSSSGAYSVDTSVAAQRALLSSKPSSTADGSTATGVEAGGKYTNGSGGAAGHRYIRSGVRGGGSGGGVRGSVSANGYGSSSSAGSAGGGGSGGTSGSKAPSAEFASGTRVLSIP
ncbi:putative cyclin 11 [Leishmania major strain Friedlin]|uniref:Putative cyclin 11 n=1 Tax=Leishmania major TaxID=5664 RepID=Q4QAE3_LEIMA|nr:putative cyclin 11 [Leishmania major strain Friedlin]CAG9574661.1 cyclin_11_-_putative [Leishmania major strain Friedlin]CAJ05269.1 putative cyclin 11 [Leishmania major strain Friedlin]|eukprot:XP_001683705.1 putative cyclin 11 [Leishmania major strain Friedlin]